MLSTKHKIIGALSVLGLLISSPTAFAASGNVVNDDTGTGSKNEIKIVGENKTEIVTKNDANVENNVSVSVNSGENNISDSSVHITNNGHDDKDNNDEKDSIDATIKTGNANADVDVSNEVNDTKVKVGSEKENEEEQEDNDNEGEGGGTTPAETNEQGGIGGGEITLATPTQTEGIGGEATTTEGIGGGELAGAGANEFVLPFALSILATFILGLKKRKGLDILAR